MRRLGTIWFLGSFLFLVFQNCSPVNFNEGKQAAESLSQDRVKVTGISLVYPEESEFASLAWEDSYPYPGDADYNDFIMNFKIEESINEFNELTEINIDFLPRTSISADDHRIALVMDGRVDDSKSTSLATKPLFEGPAQIDVTYYSHNGDVLNRTSQTDREKDLVVFASTKGLFLNGAPQMRAHVKIRLSEPQRNLLNGRSSVDLMRYRIVLRDKTSGFDIDLIDIDPTAISPNGFPFSMIVPTDWKHPKELTSIEKGYPTFVQYRQWLLQRAAKPSMVIPRAVSDWYNELAAIEFVSN